MPTEISRESDRSQEAQDSEVWYLPHWYETGQIGGPSSNESSSRFDNDMEHSTNKSDTEFCSRVDEQLAGKSSLGKALLEVGSVTESVDHLTHH